jgi:hypothetical protein
MTKEQFLNLKSEQKHLASEIKTDKSNRKTSQREVTKFIFENPYSWVSGKHWSNEQIERYNLLSKESKKCLDALSKDKSDYRYKHIIYSLSKGKTYNQIEQKVRKENKPNIDTLKSVASEYDYKLSEEQIEEVKNVEVI